MNKPMSTVTRGLDGGEHPARFGIASTARIAGHPIHPMLVPFPIAFLIGALLADLAFWNTRDPFWGVAGAWLVGAGVAGGALAALAGLTDFLGSRRVRALGTAWVHFLGNATAIVLAICNLYLRTSATSATEAVLPWGLALVPRSSHGGQSGSLISTRAAHRAISEMTASGSGTALSQRKSNSSWVQWMASWDGSSQISS